MIELSTCPCCGGKAVYRWLYDEYVDPYMKHYIICGSCKLRTVSESRHPDDGNSPDLADKWNARPSDKSPSEEIEDKLKSSVGNKRN